MGFYRERNLKWMEPSLPYRKIIRNMADGKMLVVYYDDDDTDTEDYLLDAFGRQQYLFRDSEEYGLFDSD